MGFWLRLEAQLSPLLAVRGIASLPAGLTVGIEPLLGLD